jgi:hypothetical protein
VSRIQKYLLAKCIALSKYEQKHLMNAVSLQQQKYCYLV